MSSIYLSGGGSSKSTYLLDELFLRSAGERILYLPIGLKRTFSGYDDCVNWFMSMISSHGVSKSVSVWVDIRNKVEELNKNNFDSIYIGGASDTWSLHQLLLKSNFYFHLKKFLDEGGVVYGGSGGATILGKSINYDQLEKGITKSEEKAADLCLGYSVFTHINEKNVRVIEKQPEGKVIGIPEGSGCVLDLRENKITCVGMKDIFVVDELGVRSFKNSTVIKCDSIVK